MLLGGLVGVGRKARQGSERDKETREETSVPSRLFSGHVTQR